MKKKHSLSVLFIISLFIFSSCDDPDLSASYIEITENQIVNAIDMTNFNLNYETNYDQWELAAIRSSLFRDVWVTVNGDNRGVYKLPCKIPALASDSCTVIITPAVRLNGMSGSLPAYPFVAGYSQKYFLEKGKITSINTENIKFQYSKNIKFPLLETFETGTRFSRLESDSGATFQIATLNEEKVGLLALDAENSSFEIVSDALRLPGYGNYVFLEIDYKCDTDFSVSLLLPNTSGYQSHDALANVYKTEEWKKIYINLTQSISRNYVGSDGYATNVRVYFSGSANYDELGNPIPTNIYMDNIKVVYVGQ